MARSGRLDFSALGTGIGRWQDLLGVAALLYVSTGMLSWRWNFLLRSHGIRLRLSETFSLTMIGMAFNLIMPGAVGGDVMKVYYIARRAGTQKMEIVTTTVVDRALGLFSLLLLPSVSCLLNFGTVARDRSLFLLCVALFAATAAATIGLTAAVLFGGRLAAMFSAKTGRLRFAAAVVKIALVFAAYRRNPGVLIKAVAVSAACQIISCVAFLWTFVALGYGGMSIAELFFFLPLVLVTTALPVAPAGIGVGQVAIYTLFQAADGNGAQGTSAFTVYQIVLMLVYLTGLYSYLTHRSDCARPAAKEEPVQLSSL